jgi:hypothetical protein
VKSNGDESDELQLRSYFQSQQTGQRTWDEPPSGASSIVYASEEARKMAMLQMADIQVVPAPDSDTNQTDEDGTTNKDSRSSFRRRLANMMGKKRDEPSHRPNLTYKEGSFTESFFQEERVPGRHRTEEHNVQLALAMSLRTEEDVSLDQEEREAIALAKALSLSESYNDDVVLRQVLERSKDEVDYHSSCTHGHVPFIGEASVAKTESENDYDDKFC